MVEEEQVFFFSLCLYGNLAAVLNLFIPEKELITLVTNYYCKSHFIDRAPLLKHLNKNGKTNDC